MDGTRQQVGITPHHVQDGEGVTNPDLVEGSETPVAPITGKIPTDQLMERICDEENMQLACRKVISNRGAPGIDEMTTKQLEAWYQAHWWELKEALLMSKYRPCPVRLVEIPKENGGVRQLGISTVIDRMIQQAILQILDPLFDPTFSESSYGFRRGRSAQEAVTRASDYVCEGRMVVVDIDLERFFDRVNHDKLMAKLAHRIEDKRLLKLIRLYLQAGMMHEGVCVRGEEGVPQGSPLSPLLSNLFLDALDKELERRGHRFCRYADDSNVYVRTVAAGDRVMQSITRFIETTLKLKVNRDKSRVAGVNERKFLGYQIREDGTITIAPQSLEKVRKKIRNLTKRRRSCSLKHIIEQLNPLLRGWMHYFHLTGWKGQANRLDGWIRRRLRAIKLYQLKNPSTIREFLERMGVNSNQSATVAYSGKGEWRLSRTYGSHKAMSNKWFKSMGLQSLEEIWMRLNGESDEDSEETARYGTVCQVV
jgi:RNA-directed DNA polymerase